MNFQPTPHGALPFFGVPPYRFSGVVVGALLNHPGEVAALGEAASQPPYKAPPRAPVLTVRPRNTLRWTGPSAVQVPAGAPQLAVHASLAIVIGQPASRVNAAQALACVAGYTMALDLRVPHESHYRPALRFMARDGFCTMGPQVVPAADVPQPDALPLALHIGGALAQASSTGGRTRGVAQLLADVSGFMTLQPGDVLLLGAAPGAPLAGPGQVVELASPLLGTLALKLSAEEAAA